MEHIDLEESSEHEAEELSEKSKLELSSSLRNDLGCEVSFISMYNISLESLGFSMEEEQGKDMPKVTDSMSLSEQSVTSKYKATDFTEEVESESKQSKISCNTNYQESENLSGQCSNQFPEKGPSIVQALMGAPNCSWCRRKRASKSDTTMDTNKKRMKH
ncbi:hypothetical protein DITRI_Ditri08aG0009500 [Diplodiscus trichospermus]